MSRIWDSLLVVNLLIISKGRKKEGTNKWDSCPLGICVITPTQLKQIWRINIYFIISVSFWLSQNNCLMNLFSFITSVSPCFHYISSFLNVSLELSEQGSVSNFQGPGNLSIIWGASKLHRITLFAGQSLLKNMKTSRHWSTSFDILVDRKFIANRHSSLIITENFFKKKIAFHSSSTRIVPFLSK